MKRLILTAVALAVTSAAYAAPPTQIHWQGFLTDTTGAPLHCPSATTCPSGPINIVFRLYHQPAGGQAVWTESFTAVPAHEGVVHVVLGDDEPIESSALAQDTWLGVEVNLAGELAPRQRFVSAPYALWSDRANVATNAEQLGGVPASDYLLEADLLASDFITPEDLAAALADYVTNAALAAASYIDAGELEARVAGFVRGNQSCTTGSVVTGIAANGDLVCGSNLDPILARLSALEQKVAHETLPAGTVVPFAGPLSSVPAGWLPCDGRGVAPTQYPQLFAAIGTTHGGNGFDIFYLPDYQGRFLRGVDNGRGRDPDASGRFADVAGGNVGDRVGSLQGRATHMPNNTFGTTDAGTHSHGFNDAFYAEQWCGGEFIGTGSGDTDGDNRICTRGQSTFDAGSHSHGVTGGDNDTRPVNAAVNYIIKTGQ